MITGQSYSMNVVCSTVVLALLILTLLTVTLKWKNSLNLLFESAFIYFDSLYALEVSLNIVELPKKFDA